MLKAAKCGMLFWNFVKGVTEMKVNALVGQSGGPTAVINASLAGVYKTAKDIGVDKVYGMVHGIQGFLQERYLELDEYITDELLLEVLCKTPASFLGSCRYKLPSYETDEDLYKKLFKIFERLEIKYFFYIGGNDSMDTIERLSTYGRIVGSDIRFMGVPKTIDNDLAVTDHTPGYGSAAKYVASSIREVVRDARVYDFNFVTIVEIMGRDSGWLTAAAALARSNECQGADLIYLPETPFSVEAFLDRVRDIQKQRRSIVVAVSEGIRTAEGKYVCELATADRYVDSFGHKQLTGTAQYLSTVVSGALGCKVRAIEFSTLQRCASHIASQTDVNEAMAAGAASVRAAAAGDTGKLSILVRANQDPYNCITDVCDVKLVANLAKHVPSEWIDTVTNTVTSRFTDYALPLIQGESQPVMVNGLPFHLTR